jgi:hypothetical protein
MILSRRGLVAVVRWGTTTTVRRSFASVTTTPLDKVMSPAELTRLMTVDDMEEALCKHFWATDVTSEEMELGAAQAFQHIMELVAKSGAKTDFLEHTDIIEPGLAEELNAMREIDCSTGFNRIVELHADGGAGDQKCTLLSASVCSTDLDETPPWMRTLSNAQRMVTHGFDGFHFSLRVRIDSVERTTAVRHEEEEISFAAIVGRDELLHDGARLESDPWALTELLCRVGVPGSFKSESFQGAVHANHERFVDMLLQIVRGAVGTVHPPLLPLLSPSPSPPPLPTFVLPPPSSLLPPPSSLLPPPSLVFLPLSSSLDLTHTHTSPLPPQTPSLPPPATQTDCKNCVS